jgi:chromosome segregation ATPase
MTSNVLLVIVLAVSVVTLTVTVRTLQGSQRSEDLGEDRFQLLRDQHEQLDMLREEWHVLIEELERGSQERRQLTEYLEATDPRLMEHFEQWRQARTGSEREAERLEEERRRLEQEYQRVKEELELERRGHQEILQRAEELEREQTEVSGVQQEAERLRKERQRLAEDLEKERVEMQRRTEGQELELARLKQELRRSQAEPNHRKRAATRDGATESGASRPWWRRPLLMVGLLLGVLIAWFTSLVAALNMLAS